VCRSPRRRILGPALAATIATVACASNPRGAPGRPPVFDGDVVGDGIDEGTRWLRALAGTEWDLERSSGHVRIFGGVELGGVVQSSVSKCGRWIVFCRVVHGGDIDLFRMHRDWHRPERLTESRSIEFDPSIGVDGVAAYARHDHRTTESVLIHDGRPIETEASLHKATCVGERTLLAHGSDLDKDGDRHWLVVVDRASGRATSLPTAIVIRSIVGVGGGRFVIEGHRSSDCRRVTAVYDVAAGRLSTPIDPRWNGLESPVTVPELRKELLALATRSLMSNDPMNNLSMGNNHLGRLSWKAAYRLGGLVDLLDAGIDRIGGLSTRDLADRSVRALLRSASRDSDLPGWPTLKYSISRSEELDLLVNNAAVMLPILRYLNSGVEPDPSLVQDAVDLAIAIFERNEALFDASAGVSGGYRFRRGEPFRYDGVCLPFNQQNLWGATLVELYRATGERRFLDRALELAESFRAEMTRLADGRLVWQYWPECFLRGWTADEDLSENTPDRKPAGEAWYEDVFHAKIDVDFIVRIMNATDESPFSDADRRGLVGTLRGMWMGETEWAFRVSGRSGVDRDRVENPRRWWFWGVCATAGALLAGLPVGPGRGGMVRSCSWGGPSRGVFLMGCLLVLEGYRPVTPGVGGVGEAQPVVSPRFRPSGSWVDLDPISIADRYRAGCPRWYPWFDDDQFVTYARLLAAIPEPLKAVEVDDDDSRRSAS